MNATAIDLHSNMDRLKPALAATIQTTRDDLHSNMDRLKLVAAIQRFCAIQIYIPIWID